jgi:hypothetical protein
MSILIEHNRAPFAASLQDERGQGQAPGPRRSFWLGWPIVLALAAGYLLFSHGCHADDDTELLVQAQQKSPRLAPRAFGGPSFGPRHFNGEGLSQERNFLPILQIGRQHLLNGLHLLVVLAIKAADSNQAAGAHVQHISV